MTHRLSNSSRSAYFRDAMFDESFEAVQWHQNTAADSRDADSVVCDAIVDRADADPERLGGFCF